MGTRSLSMFSGTVNAVGKVFRILFQFKKTLPGNAISKRFR
ncbi:hypothetical protein PM8797T_19737 [Gimesia maris DSM 8797]|nr:hypothetical protein PM8797T_19737 [Gimesia maris DSM 8797]